MKVLLIGATGQIGYALTKSLSYTSHQTSVLVRNKYQLAFPENVDVLEAKAFTLEAFNQALLDIDCVIYAVGLPEQFAFDKHMFQRVNYCLFKTFLEALEQAPVQNLIYISTFEVFQSIAGIVRETHSIADQSLMTPYFKSMTQAYRLALKCAEKTNLALTTIHPAAVYGGLNTGDGFTGYIENLLLWRSWRMPVIINGRFPIVHVDSLATAIVHSLGKPRAYIVSDQMTTLQEMALTLRAHAKSYIPPTVPLRVAQASTSMLEFFAKLSNVKPIMAQVQIEFIMKGWKPCADRAREELGWHPMSVNQGIQKYLQDRMSLLEQGTADHARAANRRERGGF